MADELKIRVVFDTGQANQEGRKFAEGTIGALKQQLEKAKSALLDLTKGTEAHANQLKKITQLQNEFNLALGKVPKTAGDVKPAMDKLQSGSANAAMTLQALNYTVRDSPYFFRDFSLGILAVGNNLNPLIDGLRRMNIDAKASNMTFMQMAKQTLGSGGMFTLGMSFAVTAIQALTFAMADSKKSAGELASELETLAGAADKLVKVKNPLEDTFFDVKPEDLDKTIKVIDEQIKMLDKAREGANQVVGGVFAGAGLAEQMFGTNFKEQEEAVIKILKERKATLEAERMIAEKMQSLGFAPQQKSEEEKKVTEQKLKQYFKTEEELKLEIERLKVLKEQTQNISDQYQFQLQINKLLTEIHDRNLLAGYKDVGETLVKGLEIIPEGGIKGMKPVKEGRSAEKTLKDTKLIENAVKEAGDEFKFLSNIVSQTGDAIFQSFLHGKSAVDSLITSVMILITKMLVIKGVTTLFGIGEGFNSGGVVHAASGRIIEGMGNTDTVPAMLTPGEMVLNKTQQVNLFKAINDGRFGQSENLLRTLINRVEAMNMNMLNNRPIVNIIEKTPALKFTKEVVNKNQDRLTRGNVIVGS